MKPKIKITKTMAGEGGFLFDENHISNGHWIVSREAVENEGIFNADALAALGWPVNDRFNDRPGELGRAIPPDASLTYQYTVTSRLLDYQHNPGKYIRVLSAEDGEEAYIQEDYRKRLGIEPGDVLSTSHKQGKSVLVSETRDRALMPVRK